ncbi:GNAT family N-acetyltransferase [Vibrio parahaemolyticus]|nr:GNAT family N-acetyltransferase [Vibrio parahaemolyticus]
MDSIDKSWLSRLGVSHFDENYIFSGCERWKRGGEEDLAFLYASENLTLISCSDEVRERLEKTKLQSLHEYVKSVDPQGLEVYIDDIDYYLFGSMRDFKSVVQIHELELDANVFKADFSLDSDYFYMAYLHGEPVGILASYCGVEPFESLSILVKSHCRQGGVGKALTSKWVNEVSARDRVARYRTNRDNVASRHLCESLGFVAHSYIQILAKL